jgi:phosphopantetheinyl transferase
MEPRTVRIVTIEYGLPRPDGILAGLVEWSHDEIDHMSRLRDQDAKTSWCLGRRLIRDVVHESGEFVRADLPLSHNKYGKPRIDGCAIRFNISHAPGCIALAMASDVEVGIDLERADMPGFAYLDISGAFFRDSEREWIGVKPGTVSWERFLSLFVQKEAWLKATGYGLSAPLSEAPAALAIPPYRCLGRALMEVGREHRYFLAAASLIGSGEPDPLLVVERRDFPG